MLVAGVLDPEELVPIHHQLGRWCVLACDTAGVMAVPGPAVAHQDHGGFNPLEKAFREPAGPVEHLSGMLEASSVSSEDLRPP